LAASNKLKTVICHCGRWRHVWDDDSFHDSSRSICYNVIIKTLPIWPYLLSEDLFLLLYMKILFLLLLGFACGKFSPSINIIWSRIWGFHSGEYEECCILGCSAVRVL
jgi:hypothetical protein